MLYDNLTAEQNLAFYARLYRVPNSESRIRSLLDRVDLATRRHDQVRTFSRGMKQRLAIARAILHQPDLLLLDEPYTGLDPIAAEGLSALLTDLSAAGCTWMLSTHRLHIPLLTQAVQRVVVLRLGQIVYNGPYETGFEEHYRTLITRGQPLQPIAYGNDQDESYQRDDGRDVVEGSERQESGTQPDVPFRFSMVSQIWAIVSKDLTAELHTREILSAMFVFAVLALFIFSFALDLRGAIARAASPGVLWSTLAFTGTLGLSRSLMGEHQTGAIDGLRAAPVDPTAIFFGKALGIAILMLLVECVLVPLTSVLLNVPLLSGSIVLTLALGTLGYAAIGTLLSAIAVNTRAREVMLPILLLPLLVPLFLSAVQTTRGLLEGATWVDLSGWTRLLIVYDLIIIAVSMVMFRYALEE
jgi:heme exporter protein B